MRRATLLALLFISCKEDPTDGTECPDGPDFKVVITALGAPLPRDTQVSLLYGGGVMEQYRYPDHAQHFALWCEPSDRDGNPVATGGQGGESPQGGGPNGFGGAGPSSALEGLVCSLWTDGPATLTVETAKYPTETVELKAQSDRCIVESDIELGPSDGGA